MTTTAASTTDTAARRIQIFAALVLAAILALGVFGWIKHNADTAHQNRVDQLTCAMEADGEGASSYVWTPDGGCQIIR